MIPLTDTQFRTLLAALAAVCSFVLAQPDVAVSPLVKVALGAVVVALAVINPSTHVDG